MPRRPVLTDVNGALTSVLELVVRTDVVGASTTVVSLRRRWPTSCTIPFSAAGIVNPAGAALAGAALGAGAAWASRRHQDSYQREQKSNEGDKK